MLNNDSASDSGPILMASMGLRFPYCDGVDLSFFFEVFSLEVCADPFARVCACGRQKFHRLKVVCVGLHKVGNQSGVFGVVGRHVYIAICLQRTDEHSEIVWGKEAPFVMASFWPGVREIDVETIYRVMRYEIGQKGDSVYTNYPHVCQAPSADAVNGITVVFAGPLDAEEIDVRLGHSLA